MLKLMKYEMRKTLFMKLALIAVTVICEALFFIQASRNDPAKQGTILFVLALAAIFGLLFMGIQSIVTLHRDMNTRQSYMLFMTPNSTYKILGAKVLENTLSTLLGGAIFVGIIFFDFRLLIHRYGDAAETLEFLKSLLSGVNTHFEFTFAGIAAFVCDLLCGWVATVTAAYLADVVASSLLQGKKGGGLLCIVLFIVITWGLFFELTEHLPGSADVNTNHYIQSAYDLALAGICYFVTAKLMDKYLSV